MRLFLALLLATVPHGALAQTAAVATFPPNIVIPNYNSVPAGPFGGLEASAHVARADDPSAAWFNPAGLSRAPGAQITGSAGLYQFTTVSPQSFQNTGGSVQHVPNLVGFTIKAGRLTMGAVLLTTISWIQETDAQNIGTTPTENQRRFAYSADSNFTNQVFAVSAGYDNGRSWRVGGGLAASYTSLRLVQTVSDRINEPTGLRTLLVSSRLTGSTLQFRPILGLQVDASPMIRVGGTIRTSGFAIVKSGSATLDGTESAASTTIGASFFDPSAQFEFKLPFEASGGIAVLGARAEVEVDMHAYSGISPYPMISSPQRVVLYEDLGDGAAATVQSRPFSGLLTASRAIANVSVGGRFRLSDKRPLRLHYGVTANLSPVAPEDQVFDRVNLTMWTVGLSGAVKKLSYAAGVNYSGGTSDNLVLSNVLSGQPVQTMIHVRTIGMIYSMAYQF
jgi:hypothetical protein